MSDALVRLRGHAELDAGSPFGAAATAAVSEIERLHALVLRYAVLAGELSKDLEPADPLWWELREAGVEMGVLMPSPHST